MVLISNKNFTVFEVATNTILRQHLKLDVKSMLRDEKWLIYDATLLLYLYNAKIGNHISHYQLNKLFIKGLTDNKLSIIGDTTYEHAIKTKLDIQDELKHKMMFKMINLEYNIILTNKEKHYLFQYAAPLDIVKFVIDNCIKLPDVLVDTYNKIIEGEPTAINTQLTYNEIISEKARINAKAARINEKVQNVAELYILKELARGCKCVHSDLARLLAPKVFEKSLYKIRESRKYSKKTEAQLLADKNLRKDVERWCEIKTKKVFRETKVYPDAKTRVKGDRDKFVAPGPCPVKEHHQ